ncbi:hypothetical protein CRM22_009441 [Opisthorchis felineus]|uniref:ER membrane protein complex subunit 1 n=1 Tax=Opisthorchis felineus TaxID=147828 RepID=A0A4S2L6T2_OPIFE|nr:hypothetical protein CRM22_009441 [Opisthorchis felineus]
MLLESVFEVLTVRHLCALLLSILVALVATSHLNYQLSPLWVLHLYTHSHTDDWMPPNIKYLMRISHVLLADGFEGQPVSPVRLVISNSHITTGAFIVVYHLSSVESIERFLLHSERRKSALHQLSPASRFIFGDQHVLALTAHPHRNGLVYAAVSSPTHNGSSTVANSYLISAFNESGTVLWKQMVQTPPFDTGDVFPAVTVDSRCGIVSASVCGAVFTLLPLTSENGREFSALALSLADGQILWQYRQDESTIYRRQRNNSSTRTNWKLALLDHYESHSHVDVSSWKNYRNRLNELLPFQWFGPTDSRIAVLADVDLGKTTPVVGKQMPNLLAMMHPRGIDLLDLASGKPMSQLTFNWRPGATYAFISSVNDSRYFFRSLGRNLLTQLSIHSAIIPSSLSSSTTYVEHSSEGNMDGDVPTHGDFSHMVDCRGVLRHLEVSTDSSTVGLNSQSVIHGGLCRPHSLFDFARLGRPDWLEDDSKSVPPLVFRSDVPSNGLVDLWNYLLPSFALHPQSVNLLHKHHNTVENYDIVFLTSDGSLTCVSNRGHENWRLNAEVSWLQVSRTVAGGSSNDHNLHEMYTKQFVPSLSAVRLRPFGMNPWSSLLAPGQLRRPVRKNTSPDKLIALSALVSVGWDSLSLVDLHSGRLLATHRLPSHPTGKPIVIPFTYSSDRTSEVDHFVNSLVVIPCDGMLVAFGVTVELRLQTLILVLLCLFASFIFLNLFCTLDPVDNEY